MQKMADKIAEAEESSPQSSHSTEKLQKYKTSPMTNTPDTSPEHQVYYKPMTNTLNRLQVEKYDYSSL